MFDLEFEATRYALRMLAGSDLASIAASALEHGYESKALARLAGEINPVMADAGPLFERAMVEVGVIIPTDVNAVQNMIRHFAAMIADGSISPYDGKRELLGTANLRYDVAELRGLVALEYQYDEFASLQQINYYGPQHCERVRRETEEAIVVEAKELLTSP